jgi:cytochrome b561
MPRWEIILATAVQHTLYLMILLMPLTGTLMSFLSDKGLKWFGLAVPNLIGINEPLARIFYNGHVYLSYLVIVLFVFHVAGALKHHYIDKNNILERMWGFK